MPRLVDVVRVTPNGHQRLRLPRFARVSLVAGALALATSACLAPGPGGVRNGYLPSSMLTTISPQCSIITPAAPSLVGMIFAAPSSGVQLTPISCYRTFAEQVALRNYWCGLGLCQFAAVPGTSQHGWGRAVDFADQTGQAIGFSSPAYAWLKAHAVSYCFVHPGWAEPTGSAPEPWHWEWIC